MTSDRLRNMNRRVKAKAKVRRAKARAAKEREKAKARASQEKAVCRLPRATCGSDTMTSMVAQHASTAVARIGLEISLPREKAKGKGKSKYNNDLTSTVSYNQWLTTAQSAQTQSLLTAASAAPAQPGHSSFLISADFDNIDSASSENNIFRAWMTTASVCVPDVSDLPSTSLSGNPSSSSSFHDQASLAT
jgi:hypothetical protein